MKRLLKPAIKILNSLKYPQKFILIGLIFVIPLGVVMYYFITEADYRIKFTHKERLGVTYISALASFLQHSIQYSGLVSVYYEKDASFEERLKALAGQVGSDARAIDSIDNQLGNILGTSEEWNVLRDKWQELQVKAYSEAMPPDEKGYHLLHAGVVSLIIKAGDSSNLILDPDLDSYYLMDALVNKLPIIANFLDEMRLKGMWRIIQKDIGSESQRLLLSSLYGRLESMFSLMQRGMKTAFEYNPALIPKLEMDMKEDLETSVLLSQVLSASIISAEVIAISPADYYEGFSKVIDRAFELYRAIGLQLDELLQKRINGLISRKYFVEVLALVMLVFFLYFTIAFYASVKATVSKLDLVAEGMSSDAPINEVSLESKDELGEVVRVFNKIGMKLRESYMRLEAINEELEEDIGQRREAEEEVRRLNKELEQRVIERTRELDKANEELKKDISRRQKIEKNLLVQYSVTRLLAGASSLNEVSQKILQNVCERLGWDTGSIWQIDHAGKIMHCVQFWNMPQVKLAEFEEITRKITFQEGVGLPGRVWRDKVASWIEDVTVDTNFPRAPYAAKVGLHGAFGFPIRVGEKVVGVFEFFSHELRKPDDELLAMFDSIGDQIGQLIKRAQAEEEIRQLNQGLERRIYERTMELQASYKDLQELNDFNNLLLTTIPFGMDIVDEEGNIIFMSQKFRQSFGKDITGKKCWELYKDDKQQCAKCPLRQKIKLAHTDTIEVKEVLGKRIFQISHTGMVYKNQKAILEIFEDITERKRAEEKVQFFSSIAIAVAEAPDIQSAFAIVLQKIGEATGWPYGEMWIPSLDGARLECGSSVFMRESENFEAFRKTSMHYTFAPGVGLPGRVWMSKNLAVIRNLEEDTNFPRLQAALAAGLKSGIAIPILAGKDVVSVMDFFTSHIENEQDITQLFQVVALQLGSVLRRKQVEEELKRAYNELKQTQSQLVQSAKMASVGQLAGGVAHEINNPLTGVLNNVQLIKMELAEKNTMPPENFKQILDVIEESALRCAKITRSLLDFSHAAKESFHPLSVNEMVEKVVILIGHEMRLQNIVITKEFGHDIPRVYGDSQLLQQVIFDMVSNSRWAIHKKFNAQQGGSIIIKTAYEPQKRDVCLLISDNGIGIPQENLTRIFDPFFTTKPVGEGTGLGLAIVYGIIKEHKGSIEVESKVGEGTTFKISLPAIEKS